MPRTPRRRSALDDDAAESPPVRGWQRPLDWLRRAGQFFFALSFSSLTRRIVSLNLAGLIALVASILYLSQFRAGLIDARAESLLSPAEMIARAIAATGTTETTRSPSTPTACSTSSPAKATAVRRVLSGWISRSIRNASRRCCAGWSRRPRPAPASTTATAC